MTAENSAEYMMVAHKLNFPKVAIRLPYFLQPLFVNGESRVLTKGLDADEVVPAIQEKRELFKNEGVSEFVTFWVK